MRDTKGCCDRWEVIIVKRPVAVSRPQSGDNDAGYRTMTWMGIGPHLIRPPRSLESEAHHAERRFVRRWCVLSTNHVSRTASP